LRKNQFADGAKILTRQRWPLNRLRAILLSMDFTQQREHAHSLLDALPDEKIAAVRGLLEVMVEPLSRSLAMARVDDEELTPETAAALDRARASLTRGEGVSHEEVLREFGL
jgi:hypothetical protein